jgi:hypothetical protein
MMARPSLRDLSCLIPHQISKLVRDPHGSLGEQVTSRFCASKETCRRRTYVTTETSLPVAEVTIEVSLPVAEVTTETSLPVAEVTIEVSLPVCRSGRDFKYPGKSPQFDLGRQGSLFAASVQQPPLASCHPVIRTADFVCRLGQRAGRQDGTRPDFARSQPAPSFATTASVASRSSFGSTANTESGRPAAAHTVL